MDKCLFCKIIKKEINAKIIYEDDSRRPSGLRKTTCFPNSLAHRTTWLRSDLVNFLKQIEKIEKEVMMKIPLGCVTSIVKPYLLSLKKIM